DFRRQRDDAHELLAAQLAGDRAKHTGADRLQLVVQQHRGVAVEADHGPVLPPYALARAHDNRVVDLAFLDAAARNGVLDAHLDDVTDAGVATLRAAQHLNTHYL